MTSFFITEIAAAMEASPKCVFRNTAESLAEYISFEAFNKFYDTLKSFETQGEREIFLSRSHSFEGISKEAAEQQADFYVSSPDDVTPGIPGYVAIYIIDSKRWNAGNSLFAYIFTDNV